MSWRLCCYFAGVADLAAGAALAGVSAVFALWFFLTCFLVLLAVGAAVLLVAAGALGCWAAKVNGIVATARPIASKVFFMIVFLPGGPLCPLTIPSCAWTPDNSIACAGYTGGRIRVYRG